MELFKMLELTFHCFNPGWSNPWFMYWGYKETLLQSTHYTSICPKRKKGSGRHPVSGTQETTPCSSSHPSPWFLAFPPRFLPSIPSRETHQIGFDRPRGTRKVWLHFSSLCLKTSDHQKNDLFLVVFHHPISKNMRKSNSSNFPQGSG